QARSELDQARAELRRNERSNEQLAAVKARLNEAAAKIAPGSEVANALVKETTDEGAPAQKLEVGAKVYVPRLRAEGVVVDAAQKSKLLIAVGAMKLWIDRKDLRAPALGAAEAAPVSRVHASADEHVVRSTENTLDLRGLRADDALAMLDSFIDRLYGGTYRVGFVLHGHGTGALRAAVREHLKEITYVRESR